MIRKITFALVFTTALGVGAPASAGGWYDGYGGAWHADSTGYGDDGMLHYGSEWAYGSERSVYLNRRHRHRHCWGYRIRACR